jgi:nucleoside-diphosphate-sugar epimerase
MGESIAPTALVTGATGFLGTHLVRQLRAQGVAVRALVRSAAQAEAARALGAEPRLGDLTDPASLDAALEPPVDVVFHAAADTNVWTPHNARQTKTNVDGTRALAEAALAKRVPAFVHVSSVASFSHLVDGTLDETRERRGRDSWINYERTKWAAEEAVRDAMARGLPAVILYPAHIFGPGDTRNWSQLIALIERNALPGAPPGSGAFADVREVARAAIEAWRRGRFGEGYLLGGEHATFLELIRRVGAQLGRRVPKRALPPLVLRAYARVVDAVSRVTRRMPDVTPEAAAFTTQHLAVDSSKAIRELDYRVTPLDTLLVDTVAWMRDTGLLPPPATAPDAGPDAAPAPAAPDSAAPAIASNAAAAPIGTCPNCGAPQYGPFCYACGQSKKGLIRHFSSIVGDFLDSVLNIDNRVLRTLGPLYFKPGYLSNEYFAGRRVRYVTPLRLYFFLSVIAFLAVAAVAPVPGRRAVAVDDAPPATADVADAPSAAERAQALAAVERALAFVPEAERARVRAEMLQGIAAQTAAADARPAVDAQRRRAERVRRAIDEAEDDKPITIRFNGEAWDPKTNPLTVDWLTPDMNAALNTEIGVLLDKGRALRKDPAPFFRQLFSLAPQALFVILPLFALLLKVFYLFKRRLYMEHLIVALHSHSFICLSMLVLILVAAVADWTADWPIVPALAQWAFAAAWIWLPLYLLLMQKRVYRQGWVPTVLKFGVIGVLYVTLLAFGMLFTMLASLILL